MADEFDVYRHLDGCCGDDIKLACVGWGQDAIALSDAFTDELTKIGLKEADAIKISLKLMLRAAEYGGGRKWYLPSKNKLSQHIRDRAIFLDSRKIPVRNLVAKYGLADATIYRIIESAGKAYRKRQSPII